MWLAKRTLTTTSKSVDFESIRSSKKKQTVVQSITHNIQDSVVAKDLATQEALDDRFVDDA